MQVNCSRSPDGSIVECLKARDDRLVQGLVTVKRLRVLAPTYLRVKVLISNLMPISPRSVKSSRTVAQDP